MGLPELIRGAVETVERVAGPLRVAITHTPVTGRTATGPVYGSPIAREALVEWVNESVASQDGTEHLSAAKFTFFESLTIQERDRLTVNGVTANVVKVGGLLDPATGQPYLPQAWTGK